MSARLLMWLLPVVAMIGVAGITVGRLREAATLRRGEASAKPAVNPYAGLARLEERRAVSPPPGPVRNPFAAAASEERSRPRASRAPSPSPAPVRERPVLTAIVSDADPRAVVRYEGRNYTVKAGDLFADFRVVSVSAERVVLESGSDRIVLIRPSKGE